MELEKRDRTILKSVVRSYIKYAFPVGSRTISKMIRLELSAATIRNIMADLEEMGFLVQPHTSAGRMPTDKGYRYYVDSLLEETRRSMDHDVGLEEVLFRERGEDLNEILRETTRSLSSLTRYAGILSAPKLSKTVFQHLSFALLKNGHILAVFVSADGFVHKRLIESKLDLSQGDLDRIAAELNDRYQGMNLTDIRRRLFREMQSAKDRYDTLLRTALELGEKALAVPRDEELYIGGTVNIMDQPEFADAENMKNLFKLFEEKYRIIQLLDRCMESEGVQVFIGSENQAEGMEECSLVVTTYRSGEQTLGTLGIVGPKRMDYSRVIPLVERTGRRLSRLIGEI